MRSFRARVLSLCGLALLSAACNNEQAYEIEGPGRHGVGLYDDAQDNLLWNTVKDVRGNKSEFTTSGFCGSRVRTVDVSVAGALKQTVNCLDGSFAAPFMGANAVTVQGKYALSFQGWGDNREQMSAAAASYDFYAAENGGATIVAWDTPKATTSQPSFDLNFTRCDLSSTDPFKPVTTVSIATTSASNSIPDFACEAVPFVRNILLDIGDNLITISWKDDFGNAGSGTIRIHRNDPDELNFTLSAPKWISQPALTLSPSDGAVMSYLSASCVRAGPATSAVVPLTLAPGVDSPLLGVENASLIYFGQ